jgi:hypothetical protein
MCAYLQGVARVQRETNDQHTRLHFLTPLRSITEDLADFIGCGFGNRLVERGAVVTTSSVSWTRLKLGI